MGKDHYHLYVEREGHGFFIGAVHRDNVEERVEALQKIYAGHKIKKILTSRFHNVVKEWGIV